MTVPRPHTPVPRQHPATMCSIGAAGQESSSSHPRPSPSTPGLLGLRLRAGRGKRALHGGVWPRAASARRRGDGEAARADRASEDRRRVGRQEGRRQRREGGEKFIPGDTSPGRGRGAAPSRDCSPREVGTCAAALPPGVSYGGAPAAVTRVSGIRTGRGRLPPARRSLPASLPLSRVRADR